MPELRLAAWKERTTSETLSLLPQAHSSCFFSKLKPLYPNPIKQAGPFHSDTFLQGYMYESQFCWQLQQSHHDAPLTT